MLQKQQHKKTRQEVTGYKKRIPPSLSTGPERKKTRKPGRETHKRMLSSSSASRIRESKESLQQVRSSPRPRSYVTKEAGSRPSGRAVQVQGGPVRSGRDHFCKCFRMASPYNQHRQSKQQGRQQPEQSLRS
ncbi:hypothetical protein TNIN_9631 [Trichonephila inaurata madagascariensis]|uniref:Uncharacterized protein n=1 Tax=Trichonephila inaurata madagascariensis TaxID=2747483 RepID=A0A8X6YR13_9ARAC|nr:hypothetical protein TNIN_9631 [Trichonephila inaurata madagascariensis]